MHLALVDCEFLRFKRLEMSPVVTEPNIWSFSPVLRWNLMATPCSNSACFFGGLKFRGGLFGQRAANALERLHVARRGFDSDLIGQQEIARVAGFHGDDIAAVAELSTSS